MKTYNKNLMMRFLLAFIILPILFVAIFFQTSIDHLLLFCMTLAMSLIGALEMVALFKAQNIAIPKPLVISGSLILPLISWLINNKYVGEFFNVPSITLEIVLVLFILLALTTGVFKKEQKDFNSSLFLISATVLAILYPSYLICFVVKMGKLEYSSFAYLAFFVLGFANDVFAYTCGLLFGKKSLKPFAASPKKSIVGYFGGIAFCLLFGIALYFIKPILFNNEIKYAIYISIIVSLFCNVGDLVESTFKRSSGLKDSGTIMLGRGGVLDSIDSLLFAAPIYYYFIFFLQNMKISYLIG